MATAEITPTLDLSEEFAHDALPEATHDEFARQEFVKSFKLHVATQIAPGNKVIYEKRVRPSFEKKHGRAPKDRHEVRGVMQRDPYYQFWSELLRTSQEMMWESVGSSVERQLPALVESVRGTESKHGSLRLDPDLEIPAYHTAVDIHCQPGGYHTELVEDDVAAGAVYDRAVYLYAMGRMGPFNDDIGASLAHHIRREFPDFAPKRILDLGCSVGHSTLAPTRRCSPVRRSTRSRSERRCCATPTPAPNPSVSRCTSRSRTPRPSTSRTASFDLIVSHILLHETSAKAIRRIMAECHRLLRPGGLMLHGEVPQYAGMEPFDAFILDWDTYNNNEPFWGSVHDLDLEELAETAGFQRDQVVQVLARSAFAEAEARQTRDFVGGDFGGGGQWFAFGAWK